MDLDGATQCSPIPGLRRMGRWTWVGTAWVGLDGTGFLKPQRMLEMMHASIAGTQHGCHGKE